MAERPWAPTASQLGQGHRPGRTSPRSSTGRCPPTAREGPAAPREDRDEEAQSLAASPAGGTKWSGRAGSMTGWCAPRKSPPPPIQKLTRSHLGSVAGFSRTGKCATTIGSADDHIPGPNSTWIRTTTCRHSFPNPLLHHQMYPDLYEPKCRSSSRWGATLPHMMCKCPCIATNPKEHNTHLLNVHNNMQWEAALHSSSAEEALVRIARQAADSHGVAGALARRKT